MAGGSRALDAEDAAAGLLDLAASLGAKQSLAETGRRESDLDRATDLAMQNLYPPTPPTRKLPRPPSRTHSTESGWSHDQHS
jgi:hypothetical protein